MEIIDFLDRKAQNSREMALTSLKSRRKTRAVTIGEVKIGRDFPVAIQSMCSTKTEDVKATVKQIKELEAIGCDMVRVAVPTMEAAKALSQIKSKIKMPLIADIHFDPRLAIASLNYGADKIRINPGNLFPKTKKDQIEVLEKIIDLAREKNACVRIGVNAGSLEKDLREKHGAESADALAESALRWLKFFDDRDFKNTVISVKSSQVPTMIRAYGLVAGKCDAPLHLGVTEAGLKFAGSIKSAVGIGVLLNQGIGDTIRVSLSDDRPSEIEACKEILKALKLYPKEPDIVSCPTCGRTEIDLIKMTKKTEEMIKKERIKKPFRIAILGCTVNAIGEAKEADFAIAGGREQGNIYYKGELYKGNIPEGKLLKEFLKLIREKKGE